MLLAVLLLLFGYPAFTIWQLIPFYADPWAVIDIVLAIFGVIVGFQLLNRSPFASRNTRLFIVMNVLLAITSYTSFHVFGDGWENIDDVWPSLLRIALLCFFVFHPKRGRVLFSDTPLPKKNPWHLLCRYFVGNFIGQIFMYGSITLLIVAIITTPEFSPTDEGSKGDSAQEKVAIAWLEGHPNTLKQQMGSSTGVRPSLGSASPVTTSLDAKMIYDQKSSAVVVVFTNRGHGTGFFLTADGVIATSRHILVGATDAVIMVKSGNYFPIDSILSCDSEKDYCLIKIDVEDAPFLALGDSSAVVVGDPIVLIGHPYGNFFSVSNGLISRIHEYEKAGTFFQITAQASPGSSGGPVLNTYGQVVGILNSVLNQKDAQNLNFATDVSSLRNAINP
ncbi:MAG: serine protease [bacterium]